MPEPESLEISEDGLDCSDVGAWTEQKHRYVAIYAMQFSSGMKNKWGTLVYLELYAGAGYSRIRDTGRLILGSPLLALQLKDPFHKYIFCEENTRKIEALKSRVQRFAPTANVAYIPGDCNKQVGQIVSEIPMASTSNTVLCLCFADPFDIGLKFQTLQKLSSRYVDFIVLLALHSDANRAYKRYVMEDAVKVDEFLGSRTWRDRWKIAEGNGVTFPRFLAQEFDASMQNLGYLHTPLDRMKLVRSDEKNLPLYYLALFSRRQLAHKFWDDALKYGTDQTSFSWD